MTQKQIILKYLELLNAPIEGFKLRSIQTPFGFIGSQGDRVCRQLAEKGLIHRIQMGKFAGYKTKSDKQYKFVKVQGTDTVIKVLI